MEPSALVMELQQQQQQQRRMMMMVAATSAATAVAGARNDNESLLLPPPVAGGGGGLMGGPPIDAIRQTLQRIQQRQQQKNHRRFRQSGSSNMMMIDEEDSSLEGGYNGSASENETTSMSASSSGGGSPGSSSEYDTSEDSGSDDPRHPSSSSQQQQQQQPGQHQPHPHDSTMATTTTGGPARTYGPTSRTTGRRPLLRVKRVRSDYSDSIADYSDSMILSSSSTGEPDMTASSSSDDGAAAMAAAGGSDNHHRKPGPPSSTTTTAPKVEEQSAAAASIVTDNEGCNKLFSVDCAVMAHVLTYLDPPAILDTLTMPLNKKWVTNYTRNPELWRVLCLLEPFKAEVDDDDDDDADAEDDQDSEDDDDSLKGIDLGGKNCLTNESYTKYRLTYTSFVKCARYLTRITDDSRNGRPLTVMGFGNNNTNNNDRAGSQLIAANRNLQRFFSKAREVMISEDDDAVSNTAVLALSPPKHRSSANKKRHHHHHHQNGGDNNTETTANKKAKPSVVAAAAAAAAAATGPSKLTNNLLGPSASSSAPSGVAVAGGDVELPWSCAIFSIVNWMVGFSDVEGILTMCLKALPLLLEDEQQRIAAQGSGLTDIILRSMVSFPDSALLHTAAFHTIVLLARPIGGREGMLFHSSMVNTNGIFNPNEVGSASGKSGIAVLLDSMRRFVHDEALQAMGCWSLVNIALAPSQQDILIKLGAVDVALTAMVRHKDSAEVQFRALFALINLIIPPSLIGPRDGPPAAAPGGPAVAAAAPAVVPPPPQQQQQEPDHEASAGSDSDGSVDVDQIVELVVGCMKHYSTNESILNRACLVLHNLSLNTVFHSTMLWTPHCYLMLEWCLKNYPNDRVLQQGALNTIQRLQTTLSRNAAMRKKFRASLKSQRVQFREQVETSTMRTTTTPLPPSTTIASISSSSSASLEQQQ